MEINYQEKESIVIGLSNLGKTTYKVSVVGSRIRVEKYNFTWGHFVGLFIASDFLKWSKVFIPGVDFSEFISLSIKNGLLLSKLVFDNKLSNN